LTLAWLPKPIPGLVVRYRYLWASEFDLGREEGLKDRPCAIILAVERRANKAIVVVLPITHSPPSSPADAFELPLSTKRRLGLDDDRSWVVLTEANEFTWPGFDLRPIEPNDPGAVSYGELPAKLFRNLRSAFVEAFRSKRTRLVPRDE